MDAAGLAAVGLVVGFVSVRFAAARGPASGLRGDEMGLRAGAFCAPDAVCARPVFFAPATVFRPPAFFTPVAAFGRVVFLAARDALVAGRGLREDLVGFAMMVSRAVFCRCEKARAALRCKRCV